MDPPVSGERKIESDAGRVSRSPRTEAQPHWTLRAREPSSWHFEARGESSQRGALHETAYYATSISNSDSESTSSPSPSAALRDSPLSSPETQPVFSAPPAPQTVSDQDSCHRYATLVSNTPCAPPLESPLLLPSQNSRGLYCAMDPRDSGEERIKNDTNPEDSSDDLTQGEDLPTRGPPFDYLKRRPMPGSRAPYKVHYDPAVHNTTARIVARNLALGMRSFPPWSSRMIERNPTLYEEQQAAIKAWDEGTLEEARDPRVVGPGMENWPHEVVDVEVATAEIWRQEIVAAHERKARRLAKPVEETAAFTRPRRSQGAREAEYSTIENAPAGEDQKEADDGEDNMPARKKRKGGMLALATSEPEQDKITPEIAPKSVKATAASSRTRRSQGTVEVQEAVARKTPTEVNKTQRRRAEVRRDTTADEEKNSTPKLTPSEWRRIARKQGFAALAGNGNSKKTE